MRLPSASLLLSRLSEFRVIDESIQQPVALPVLMNALFVQVHVLSKYGCESLTGRSTRHQSKSSRR